MPRHLSFALAGLLLLGCRLAVAIAEEPRLELPVHLAQANNDSPYAFVRSRFEPGEVVDPWAVRFVDRHGRDVPYFVWDWLTFKTAREGRADWGHRYALMNHHPGNSPEALRMRPHRLEAAKQQFPGLGALLAAQDAESEKLGNSVCVALYLVRHAVPALGREKLTLKVYSKRQTHPNERTLASPDQPAAAAAGDLILDGLPGRLSVHWKGKELFRYAGFKIGDKSQRKDGSLREPTHAEEDQPFEIQISEGIVTRLSIRGRTNGRGGSGMDWQCVYWLFPEGGYVALKGFSLDNTDHYLGGTLSMAVWETPAQPRELRGPTWQKPWWLHQMDDAAFVAVHQFPDTPLAVGYGNNPFNASTPASFQVWAGEKTKGQGDGVLELNWTYELTDRRTYRLFHPLLDNDGSYDLAELTDLRETLLTHGKLTNVPTDATWKDGSLMWPPERVSALEEALSYVKWRPREDWLYRQYVVGVGEEAAGAEQSVRQVLGAAAGWLDRPFDEEELAEIVVGYSLRKSSQLSPASHVQSWMVMPAILHQADRAAAGKLLGECPDPAEMASDAIRKVELHVAGGGQAISGYSKNGGEGWLDNPVYSAVDVPVALRFMEHFDLFGAARQRKADYRKSLVQWADFSLEVLGGKPLDLETLRASYRSVWSNRLVMLIPLLLRAYRETGDEEYAAAARLLFDDVLMAQVEQNPHGYFWAWGHSPQQAEMFDLNYNIAAYDRGIVDFWSEGQLAVVGRERATRFVAAQARHLAASGQLLDTLETDNMAAVGSNYPGQVPFAIGQAALFLHDDFPFYRGLVGNLIRWGAIDDGGTLERREGRRNLYTLKIGSRVAVFWTYGIGRDAPPSSKTAREMLATWRSASEPDSNE